jgi:hypothetical protein
MSSNITVEEAQTLFDLICRERPRVTAEIGCAHGVSTLAILGALEHNQLGEHHVVDPFQSSLWHGAGRTMAGEFAHRATFYDNFPEEVFPTLPDLDFVFIDGSHLFDFTILDFVLSDKRLRVGGIIGFHDTWMAAIRNVLRFILSNRAYKPLCLNGAAAPPPTYWQRLRFRAGLKAARFISGESDLIVKREPFSRLGLDKSNLVFIQKMDAENRDWRYFVEF